MSNYKIVKEIWETLEFNNKKDKKSRTYIAWEISGVSKSSKIEEQIHLSFMVSHHSDDDDEEVSDFVSINKLFYDELHDAFNNLYDECLKLSKLNAKQKKIISSLETKSNDKQRRVR